MSILGVPGLNGREQRRERHSTEVPIGDQKSLRQRTGSGGMWKCAGVKTPGFANRTAKPEGYGRHHGTLSRPSPCVPRLSLKHV